MYQHEWEERKVRTLGDFFHGEAPPWARRGLPTFAGPEYWEDVDAYLEGRGLSAKLARYNGWYPSGEAGDNHLRVVMPGFPASLGFWQARALNGMADVKRYQSPHGPRNGAVIVTYPSDPWIDTVVVVEGPMDALATSEVGAIGIALMGNTPSANVFDVIAKSFGGFDTIVVPDRDALKEGAENTFKLASRGVRARMQTVLPWKDLAEVPRSERASLLWPEKA